MGEWISVRDALPEKEQDVLLYFAALPNMVVGGRYVIGDEWYAYADGEFYTDCDTIPTYWAYLPEPPEEDL